MESRTRPSARRSACPTRRQFLTTSATLVAAGITAPALRAAAAGPGLWDLEAVTLPYTFGDGASIPFFRYRPVAGGATRGSLPYFEATEGTAVSVSVHNQLPVPIRPSVLGVAAGGVILPGATGVFAFTMPPAGTYLLSTSWRGPVSGQSGVPIALLPTRPTSGLSGTLVSRPVGGGNELWAGGPTFDREYVLLWDDADDRWNAAQSNLQQLDLPQYEPNYFTVNGLAFPDSASDPDTRIVGNVGERILIRNLNAGSLRQAIHLHGYHSEAAARNNVPVTNMPPKDTWPLPKSSTLDMILTPNQAGVFPLHPHHVFAVTANGLYPFGSLVLQDIS